MQNKNDASRKPSGEKSKKNRLLEIWNLVRIPVLAFVTAIIAGAILIIITDLNLYAEIRKAAAELTFFSGSLLLTAAFIIVAIPIFILSPKFSQSKILRAISPAVILVLRLAVLTIGITAVVLCVRFSGFGPVFETAFNSAFLAFGSMASGSIGNISQMADAIRSGDIDNIAKSVNSLSESLVATTPYIFSGLSVAVALRCGIFNIGTEGQIYIGALTSAVVGYTLKGLPPIIHLPLAMIAGALGGALWAFIPAILKTRFGSNEVINTIMLNYIAFRLSEFLLNGPIRRPGQTEPLSPYIEASAELPRFLPYPSRFHLGFFIAIAVAIFLYWYLFRTPAGLEIRLVGKNPNASRYAGINISLKYILAFSISGAMGGLAGANEVLGVNHYLSGGISPGYGFDAISLSILGNNHPIGVIFTSLLFGFLRNGGTRMQNIARVPIEIITLVQALVIAFIAAPSIIRSLFKLKEKRDERITITHGWGK